ncbi:hypothetical protein T01_1730 [Trichinella spiralis]|uniref:Uncharacterized protein n=1 Tax=Trichinella spiralis TaxID=6334 RepID=A0A0V1B9S8_TRISP|nr:hypothetical protein T01_1730 [Trichinella spiralis]
MHILTDYSTIMERINHIVFNQTLQNSLIYPYITVAKKKISKFRKNIFHPKRENSKVYSPRNFDIFENPIFLKK